MYWTSLSVGIWISPILRSPRWYQNLPNSQRERGARWKEHARGKEYKFASSVLPSLPCAYCCCSDAMSCPILCDPMDYSPPGSSVHGISQARILEWVAISSSTGSSPHRDQTWMSCLAGRFFTTGSPGKPMRCLLQILETSGLSPWPIESELLKKPGNLYFQQVPR